MGVLYFMQKTSIILHFYIDGCFYFLYFKIVRNRVVMRFNAYLDMQKSRKLMVSLCGLALSSLFVLNNKSVVHADTVDANQSNNAISWDSDSDAAQNVQSVDVQNEQNSDVQSNVQNTQAAQKVDNNQQNATSEQLQRAETSTVRSSSAAPRTTNQNTAVQSPRVANVQDAQKTSPVVINNPANNKVHVHYVDSTGHDIIDKTGKSVDIGDYDISTSNTVQNGSYKTPKDYMLVNSGKYNVNVSHSIEGTLDVTTAKFFGKDGKPAPSGSSMKGDIKLSDSDAETVHRLSVKYESKIIDGLKNGTYKIGVDNGKDVRYITEQGGKDIPDLDDFTYAGWLTLGYDNGTFDRVKPSDLQKYNFEVQLVGKTKSGHIFRTFWGGLDASDAATLGDIWTRATGENYKKTIDYMWKEAGNTSSDSYSFMTDYSNAKFIDTSTFDSTGVKAVHGNTVDVAVMRPQSVNPATDARMKATATRTIQINFPGSIPPSYKNIVNDKGVLTQTVTFTRTGSEDALTGNLIDSTLTPWKSNNQDPNFLGFPERTLPRIPGYTLSIKPANA